MYAGFLDAVAVVAGSFDGAEARIVDRTTMSSPVLLQPRCAGSSAAPGELAREAVDEMAEAGLLNDLMGRIDEGEARLTGQGGFLPEMIKRVRERGLHAEISDNLGYAKYERAGNSRNGTGERRPVRPSAARPVPRRRRTAATSS